MLQGFARHVLGRPPAAAVSGGLLALLLAPTARAERPVFRTHALSEHETLEFILPPHWEQDVRRDEDTGLPRITWNADGLVAELRVERAEDLERAGVIPGGSYTTGESEELLFQATFDLLGRAAREQLGLEGKAAVDLEALSPATAIAATFTPKEDAPDGTGYGTAVIVHLGGYVVSAAIPSTVPDDEKRRRLLDALGDTNLLGGGVRHAAMPEAPRLVDGRFTSAQGELAFDLPASAAFEQLDAMGLAWLAVRAGEPVGVLGVDVYEGETTLPRFDARLKKEWLGAGKQLRGCEEAHAGDGTLATRCQWVVRGDGKKALETATLVRGDRAVLVGWGGDRKAKHYAPELDRLLASLRFAAAATDPK